LITRGTAGGTEGGGSTHLSNESENFPEPLALLVWLELKEPTHGLVVVELLEELLPIPSRITLDQVLELREVRREQSCSSPIHRRSISLLY
jgi:hypothetical protein